MSLDPQTVPFLRSCERCRHKKRKCSGDRPSCTWCTSHNIPCRYRRTMRFKKQLEVQPESSLDTLSTPVMFSNVKPSVSDPAAISSQLTTAAATQGPISTGNLGNAAAGDLFSADALARLLSVDMVPSSNPPPANLLQMVNSYMTPLAGSATPLSGPEWSAMTNTEANMLANLGDMAALAHLNSAYEWMPVGFTDPLMDSGSIGSMSQDFLSDELIPPFGADRNSTGTQEPNTYALTPDIASFPMSPTVPRPGPLLESLSSQTLHSNISHPGPSLPSVAAAPSAAPVSGSSNFFRLPASPIDYIRTNFGPPQPRSPVTGVAEIVPGMLSGIDRSSPLSSPVSTYAPPSGPLSIPAFASTSSNQQQQQSHRQIKPKPQKTYERKAISNKPRGAMERPGPSISLANDEIVVPPILEEYVASIPGKPSPVVIYKIMRETFRAPRMGMVSMNLEMLWHMLHKGVLPRIVFYGHISSTIRCSVADLDIKAMVPSHIDESCYELALNEVPKIKDCSAIWGAVGLCMVTRYEFQSSRYKEMAVHVDMALDVMHRIQFVGHSYPWHGVAAADKESFGFQYLLAIYWKCFLWKLMSLMLIETNVSFVNGLEGLPEYSSKTYDLYTSDLPYDVDLMEMIPPNSWFGANSECRPNIRFRGPSDAEFMRNRPEGSPCFNRATMSGSYMQQLLVVFARFFVLQDQARCGKIEIGQLLKGLWVYKERMRMWRYSLPPELILDSKMVDGYLAVIRPDSSATPREIDLRASRLKDIIMLLLTYHTFIVRANRFVMKMMLGEPLDVPAPDVTTMSFGIRDLYDSKSSPGTVTEALGHMNMYFHGCRIQAIKSANALCSIIQAAYSCRFNFYTLGSPIIFTIFELLVVYISFLRNCDPMINWRSKARLSNVFNILRMLRHWAPALHMFVSGIKALSDPTLCLEEPYNFNVLKHDVMDPSMLDMADSPVDSNAVTDDEDDGTLPPKRRRVVRLPQALETIKDARTNILNSIAPPGIKLSTDVKRDETLSYRAADPIPEFPNPFPPKHIITLIIKDLGLSLTEFLAPAYPILLLKLIPSGRADTSKMQLFGGVGRGGINAAQDGSDHPSSSPADESAT
ncbi:hypothetical protein BX661DRAFT_178574 [Kickxella alabastrina]|uniref:uncharacterized protein n=1 Tax=Kickxella alabastrina TaxID=61397 RepID=UPI00221FF76A|nr:uncharacterized protein BX661DRAFT_178574 [Kickxella alabastrina]KAI7833535.1 hypothetical protein BX661DRAFT_178574 [Kickxella alabastrina]